MLNRIILLLGVTATCLVFVLVVLDLVFLGKRNLIRSGVEDLGVFIWLFGLPSIILLLLLLINQEIPKYLFPIQGILLIVYGKSRKQIVIKLHNMDSNQFNKNLENEIERISDHLLTCFIKFVNIIVILALAICGALWVLSNEDNPWISYPAVILIGLFIGLAQIADYMNLANQVLQIFRRKD